jgi:hypothetical protein
MPQRSDGFASTQWSRRRSTMIVSAGIPGAGSYMSSPRFHRMLHPDPPMIPFSVLDLAPIRQGGDASQAFRNSLDLAQHAEAWGYKRFWLAEHTT